jgi:hypothetical protein
MYLYHVLFIAIIYHGIISKKKYSAQRALPTLFFSFLSLSSPPTRRESKSSGSESFWRIFSRKNHIFLDGGQPHPHAHLTVFLHAGQSHAHVTFFLHAGPHRRKYARYEDKAEEEESTA